LTSVAVLWILPLLNVLIVPDKFKGTLPAGRAAEAMARGWHRARPEDTLELLPMTDGGDGFGEVLGKLLLAAPHKIRTVNAAHQQCVTKWWWHTETKTAVVESAAAIGLAMLPPGKFHPFQLDTLGLGLMLKRIAERGVRRCLVGIGGSATNDGGFGLARALGWEFVHRDGNRIERWTELPNLKSITLSKQELPFEELMVATDVANPLLGCNGATRVYGPQKGLKAEHLAFAEGCLRRMAGAVSRPFGSENAHLPGAGAGGGLGFGLVTFAGARLIRGFELFAEQAGLERHLRQSQLVITGEGALDNSSLMGKGVGEIARRCQQLNIPCLGFSGLVDLNPAESRMFAQVHALTELTSPNRAKTEAAYWLPRLAFEVAKNWRRNGNPDRTKSR
jgi:glycerate kinase